MSRFMDPRYDVLKAYTPGEQPRDKRYIKLNTNESPYPPAPEVVRALTEADAADLRLYSDPVCADLRDAIAEHYGVGRGNVFATNGSDDTLLFAFSAFAQHRGALFPDVTYGLYPVFCNLLGIDYATPPLLEDFTVNPSDYLGKNRFIALANPNAPTGIALPAQTVEEIAASNPDDVVMVDEAYVDFGGASAVGRIGDHDNLIVVMTYSKSRSMAGARLGFAIGPEALVLDLEKLRYSTNPYNIDRLNSKLGAIAMRCGDYYAENCRKTAETRARATEGLRALGFEVLPSSANFVFARHPRISGEALYLTLKERGILVRHFTQSRICDYNRITIGLPEEMDALLKAAKDIIEGASA